MESLLGLGGVAIYDYLTFGEHSGEEQKHPVKVNQILLLLENIFEYLQAKIFFHHN